MLRRRLDELYPQDRHRIVAQALRRTHLAPQEMAWRNKQQFLEEKGYMLRPRLCPGWTPSWTLPENKEMDPKIFEDYYPLPIWPSLITDATRISDGRLVSIKRISTSGAELAILKVLSSGDLSSDPRNHCVPIYEHFCDDQDPQWSYIVMPFLLYVNKPPFETVADVIDFVSQMLEGLLFLHEHDVAHRDCEFANILMDASSLFPEGFHPLRRNRDPTGTRYIDPLPRAGKPVKYYFIDFGIASHMAKGRPRMVTGIKGRDDTVPELSLHVPYDPFKADIYILGNNFRETIYDHYSNVEFLSLLINKMTQREPDSRLSAREAFEEWRKQCDTVSDLAKTWPLRSRTDPWLVNMTRDGITALNVSARTLFGWITGGE